MKPAPGRIGGPRQPAVELWRGTRVSPPRRERLRIHAIVVTFHLLDPSWPLAGLMLSDRISPRPFTGSAVPPKGTVNAPAVAGNGPGTPASHESASAKQKHGRAVHP